MIKPTFDSKLMQWAIPIILISLNIILKWDYVQSTQISFDEFFTIYFSQFQVYDIVNILSKGNNPPLFEILLHFWGKIFGISQLSIRFLPFIFSIATPLVMYYIGKKHFSGIVGICAALALSFSSVNLYQIEARVYTLFVLLTSLSLLFYLNLLNKPQKKSTLLGLIICNTLLVYSHYLAIFIPLIQFISTLIIKNNRKKIGKSITLVLSVTFILYLPYLYVFISRLLDATHGTWVKTVGLKQGAEMFWIFLNQSLVKWLWLIIILGYFVVKLIKKQTIDGKIITILLWFCLPFTLMFLTSWGRIPFTMPVFMQNYLLFTSPSLYLLISIILYSYFKNKYVKIALPLGFVLLMCFYFRNDFTKPKTKEIVDKAISLSNEKKNPILLCGNHILNFTYNYSSLIFQNPQLLDPNIDIIWYSGPLHTQLRKDNIFAINEDNLAMSLNLLRKIESDTLILFCTYDDEAGNHVFFQKTKAYLDSNYHQKKKIAYIQKEKKYEVDPQNFEDYSDNTAYLYLYTTD